MDTQTFWTTVGLIVVALIIITPLAYRAVDGDPHHRSAVHAAGMLAALSFTLDAGVVAAAMTIPWLGIGGMLVLIELRSVGLAVLVRRPQAAVLGPLATWAWMAAGAAWLTAHRLGLEPLGFDRAITLLTVAHFHVAGLGLTALMAMTHQRRPSASLLAAIWLHQVGMLTVAAGLTFSDHLEVVGAAAITVALGVWAVVVIAWIRAGLHGAARLLLIVAAIAWIAPMALAFGWALGPFLPEPVLTTFMTMLRYHAALQTFGLVLCGLGGGLLTAPASRGREPLHPLTDNNTTEDHHAVDHETHA